MGCIRAWLSIALVAAQWLIAPALAAQAIGEGTPPFSLPAASLLEQANRSTSKPTFGSVSLFESYRFEFDADRRLTETHYRVYRIDSADAIENFDQVQAIWDPSRQQRPVIRGRVVTREGREHQFDPATLSDESVADDDPRIFDDIRALRGPLPAIAVGSVVEVESIVTDDKPAFGAGVLQQVYLGAGATVESTIVTVTAPESVPLRYVARLLPDAKVTDTTEGGRRTIVLRQGLLAIDYEDIYVEASGELPVWPEFQLSTGESWPIIEAQYEELAAPFIRPEEVRSLLPADLPAEREARIGKLLDILHERVRYTGVLFGQGKIVPNPPSVTLERRFGDCKDKSVVFASLLRAAGIPANVVLLHSATGVDVDPSLPGITGFNHMIVYVPGDRPLWIDPTWEHSKVGEIPAQNANRWALVIGEQGGELVRTPALKPQDGFDQERQEIRMADFGQPDVRISGRQRGTRAAFLRSVYADQSSETAKLRDDAMKAAYRGKSVEDFKLEDDEATGELVYSLNVRRASIGSTDYADARVAFSLWKLFTDLPTGLRVKPDEDEDDDEEDKPKLPRTADWVFEPFIKEWQVTVLPPTGFHVRSLPADREIAFGPAKFTQRFSRNDQGEVQGAIRLDSVSGRYTADEGRRFLETWLVEEEGLNLELHFDHDAAALIESGEEVAGLKRHRDLQAAEPGKAIHHMREAASLLEFGLVEEARAAAQRATELEPKNDRAFLMLGKTYEHNGLGIRFGKGFKPDEAMRAFREAARLVPDDDEAWHEVNIAALAEHDAEGVRYGQGADLKLAIDTYREILKKAPNWNEGKSNLVQALWHARRFPEVAAVNVEGEDAERIAAFRIAARVMQGGVETALREDASRGVAAARRARIEMATVILWIQGYYDEARSLAAAGGSDRRQQSQAVAATQMIAKTVHESELPAPADTAAGAAESVIRIALAEGVAEKELRPWFAEEMSDKDNVELLLDQIGKLDEFVPAGVRRFSGNNLTFFRDIMLSNLEYAETDFADGVRRVGLHMNGMAASAMYMVQEKKGWRLVSTAPLWNPFGRRALAALDAGAPERAFQLLAAVREDIEREGMLDSPWGGNYLRAFPHETAPTDSAALRLAAYLLLTGPQASTVRLAEARQAIESRPDDSQHELWYRVLASAAEKDGDHALMVSAARDAFAAEPGSSEALEMMARIYGNISDWTELERVSRTWLARAPANEDASLWLQTALNGQGRVTEALELTGQPVKRGRANPGQLNQHAWQTLLADAVDQAAVTAAENSFNQRSRRDYASGHTLACVYAARGQIAESRELLMQMIDELPQVEPESGDIWLIRGLVAESLGYPKAAVAAYEEIEVPKRFDPGSVYDVASRRLAKINGRPVSP